MHAVDAQPRWRPIQVIIAGGGTGGHLFPGIALADEFVSRNPESRIRFVGAGRPFERNTLARVGYVHRGIIVEGLKGRRLRSRLRALAKLLPALQQALGIVAEAKAELVVGVGGYAAGPVALAAWLKGVPVVLCEQNTIPGMTNRMLSPLARRIYLSFEHTRGRIAPSKRCVTGNPVRADLLNASAAAPPPAPATLTVMVVGGSQGAHAINLACIDALGRLRHADRFGFIHQTGAADLQWVRRAYRDLGVIAEVQPFFHDMASRYRRADVVICRAGATTVAELTALGKAALFIPYPFAADNHQVYNARELVDCGAAQMILERELSGEVLARRLDAFADSPLLLQQMAARSRHLGRPDAARRIVDDCYRVVGKYPCI